MHIILVFFCFFSFFIGLPQSVFHPREWRGRVGYRETRHKIRTKKGKGENHGNEESIKPSGVTRPSGREKSIFGGMRRERRSTRTDLAGPRQVGSRLESLLDGLGLPGRAHRLLCMIRVQVRRSPGRCSGMTLPFFFLMDDDTDTLRCVIVWRGTESSSAYHRVVQDS